MDRPFFVLATQNPIELEGTYPLPEAQLDRFMFNIIIEYLDEEDELKVVTATTANRQVDLVRSADGRGHPGVSDAGAPRAGARVGRALCGVAGPRQPAGPDGGLDFVKEWVNWGASLRASQYLVLGGKARALLNGRFNVSIEDIQALAYPVMRHRILTNFHAESQRMTTDEIIRRLLEAVPVPKSGL